MARIKKSCEVCGNTFQTHPYSIRNGHGRFCSLKCKSVVPRPERKTGKNIKCFFCKKSFYAQLNVIKRGCKYCSQDCYHKSTRGNVAHNKGIPMSEDQKRKLSLARRGKMTGSSNPSWKGGITPRNKVIRNSPKYLEWRKSIFERDSYTCNKCEQRGGLLQADHIKPFALFPDLRFALSNGQTLCKPCHLIKTKKDLKIIKK